MAFQDKAYFKFQPQRLELGFPLKSTAAVLISSCCDLLVYIYISAFIE